MFWIEIITTYNNVQTTFHYTDDWYDDGFINANDNGSNFLVDEKYSRL